MHSPQPVQSVSSIRMVPSSCLITAGHPGFKHIPHFLHFSGIALHLPVILVVFKSTQGDFVTMTDTSSFAVSSLMSFLRPSISIYLMDALDSQCLAEIVNINGICRISHQCLTCCGVILMSCHTCCRVVKYDDCSCALVVYHVHE